MRPKQETQDPTTSIGVKQSTRERLFKLERYRLSMDGLINEMIDVYIEHKDKQ
jgi:hypothetical protein